MKSNYECPLSVDFNNLKTVLPILLISVLRSPPWLKLLLCCVFFQLGKEIVYVERNLPGG